MNILISTTSNWNPGDDIIRYGVQYLLEQVLGPDINYIFYNRNPDYFTPGQNEMGNSHKSNGYTSPINWSRIDLVVLAGSPEWLHGPLKPIYDGLAENPHIPLIAIGVGYTFEMGALIPLTDNERKVLERSSTIIITRQYDLGEKIGALLGREVTTLPCPGVFSSFKFNRHKQDKHMCVIRQVVSEPQSISLEDYLDTEAVIGELNTPIEVVCHYIKDFNALGGYFNSEAQELIKHIMRYNVVISNRLHGGLAALGNGSQVKFINSNNRVVKALEPFKAYEKNAWYSMGETDIIKLKQSYLKELKKL